MVDARFDNPWISDMIRQLYSPYDDERVSAINWLARAFNRGELTRKHLRKVFKKFMKLLGESGYFSLEAVVTALPAFGRRSLQFTPDLIRIARGDFWISFGDMEQLKSHAVEALAILYAPKPFLLVQRFRSGEIAFSELKRVMDRIQVILSNQGVDSGVRRVPPRDKVSRVFSRFAAAR